MYVLLKLSSGFSPVFQTKLYFNVKCLFWQENAQTVHLMDWVHEFFPPKPFILNSDRRLAPVCNVGPLEWYISKWLKLYNNVYALVKHLFTI